MERHLQGLWQGLVYHSDTSEELNYLWDLALDVLDWSDHNQFLIGMAVKLVFVTKSELES
jgi:hypothetical protein